MRFCFFSRPNKKNICVSGNWSENFRLGRHTYFFKIIFLFRKKNKILCILKGMSPFKMHKIIFFLRKPEINCMFHQ